jgi:hypothetical protein
MAITLANLRIGFACKERWEDMVGDDRVRACAKCERSVFNLSAMTRAEAEAVLATRGLTPCVRFYRRPDGTVMTSDCPTSPRVPSRRLAVAASSLAAAGSVLAAGASEASADEPPTAGSDADTSKDVPAMLDPDNYIVMGGALDNTYTTEVGIIISTETRPAVEWSVWGRLGAGAASPPASEHPDAVARRVIMPDARPTPASTTEAALGADLTFRVARDGDLRFGAWGEIRTSSDPVAGAELVLEGLSPHPYDSRIGGAGSLVLRAGANARVVTAALGFGYVGSFPRHDPWLPWARHVVGARVVVSANRAIDDPHEWSATLGLEVEPIGAVHALLDVVRGR